MICLKYGQEFNLIFMYSMQKSREEWSILKFHEAHFKSIAAFLGCILKNIVMVEQFLLYIEMKNEKKMFQMSMIIVQHIFHSLV